MFWDAVILWQLIASPSAATPWATTQVNIANSFISFQNWSTFIQIYELFTSVTGELRLNSGSILNIQDLQWVGDRPIGVDAGWNIIEMTGWSGAGTNFTVEDGLAQTLNVIDNTTLQITGRPGSVIQTVFDTPENLQVRIEWGSPGQVVGYHSDFGAGWVSVPQAYSLIEAMTSGVPFVHTHGHGSDNIIVQVYDSTGNLVTPTINVTVTDVTITASVTDTYRVSLILF